MRYQRRYGGIIWTNHAIERLHARKLPQDVAYRAFETPDARMKGKRNGALELQKQYQDLTITLIVKKNPQGEWLVISAWVDPPFPGTEDHRKQTYWQAMQKAGFWRKIFLTLKHQIGL